MKSLMMDDPVSPGLPPAAGENMQRVTFNSLQATT